MYNIRRNKKGFTLVELIVVIAILAILAGTAAGIGVTLINKNTNKTAQSEAENLVNDFKLFMQDKQSEDDFNLDNYAAATAAAASDPINDLMAEFIASLNEDEQQKGKLTDTSIIYGAAKTTKNDLENVEGKKLTAGSHKFYAYVEFTAATTGEGATAASLKVTFACAAKGKFNGKEVISSVYTYANQVG